MAADELRAWAGVEAATVVPALVLEVDGARVELALETADASLEAGQAGLEVLRLQVVAAAPLPRRGALAFTDTPRGRAHRVARGHGRRGGRGGARGVRRAGDESERRAAPVSTGCRREPARRARDAGVLRTGLDRRRRVPGRRPVSPGLVGGDRLVGLLGEGGWSFLLLGLLLAVAFGAWHALMPGHGKTLMAGAMIGSRGGIRQAAAAAAAVAGMHSASVLALGVAVLALEATFRPETLYPWLTVVSGVAAIAVGRFPRATAVARVAACPVARDRRRPRARARPRARLPIDADGRLGLRGVGALALAGGIVPAPSALLVLLAAIQLHRTRGGGRDGRARSASDWRWRCWRSAPGR